MPQNHDAAIFIIFIQHGINLLVLFSEVGRVNIILGMQFEGIISTVPTQ